MRLSKIFTRQILMGCTFLAVAFTAIGQQPTAEELFDQGMAEYNQINYGAALAKFREAADLGHAASQTMLALLLDASEFNEEAREWYEKAVAQNNVDAQMGLAKMLALGDGGEPDLPRARSLYEAAAGQGNHQAMRVLYSAYSEGQLGLEPDAAMAEHWLQTAANAGDAWSQQKLASQENP